MAKHVTPLAREFLTTHWSIVVRVRDPDPRAQRQALEALLRAYHGPLMFHLCGIKRINHHKAEDILQGFVADKLIERDLFARARAERGRLRNLLLTALDRYVIDIIRREGALIRDPKELRDLDCVDEPVQTGQGPDSFDVEWARTVLEQSVDLMRQNCESTGRPELWGVFEARLLDPLLKQTDPIPYTDLIDKLGFVSPGRAAEALVVAKKLFSECLHEVVGRYAEAEDIDSEITDLKRILVAR